jgi:diguanylate cyclase (GGDEF)-like protein/PAS domain S-box-containing protein
VEKEILINNHQLQAVFEQAAVGMVIVEDAQSRYVKVNRRFCEIVGYSAEELLQGSIHDITHPDDVHIDLDHVRRIRTGIVRESSWEKRYRKKDGTIVWARVFVTPLDSSEATPTLRLGVIEDITDRKRTEEALRESEARYRELSIVDDLTQLYNSRHFYHQLKMEIDRADRYGQPLTLLLLDLDDFKRFNDAYGHIEGDQVLMRLGEIVKRCLRQSDSAYRYGGEEFVILLPMTTSADGALTAERIRTEFKKENFSPTQGQEVHVTVSIGVAQCKPQEEMKAFVHRVDQLMYQGKKNGKDQVCCES